MWNLRGNNPAEKAAGIERLRRSFDSLRHCIPGLLHLEIGVDSSSVDYACDVVLYSEFESAAALDAYQNHPQHLALKPFVGAIRLSRQCMDYEVK